MLFSLPRFLWRRYALIACVICFFSGLSQDRDSLGVVNQISFQCDNNFFLFNGEDGYYTSGMFLRYDRLARKSSRRTMVSYEIGQMIYNAHARKILPYKNNSAIPGGIEQIDRPIAGYLFGKMSVSSFFSERDLLIVGVSVGSTGKNSLGRNTQEFWHRMIGVKDYWNWIWDYQIKNEMGMNLHGTYAHSVIDKSRSAFVQITPVSEAIAGTSFAQISQAALLQVGRLQPMSSSSYWHSRFGSSSLAGSLEFFIYYQPEVRYQLYNATIQGGMFREDKGPIVSASNQWVISHEVGARFSTARYCLGYSFVHRSKEAASQFHQQWFASVYGAFRW